MKKATSAGGIVVRNNPNKQILLIEFYNNTGLSFPKGHVENSESLGNAAIREVSEETGITGLKIIKKLGVVTRPAVETDGTKVIKDIHLFLMETDNYDLGRADEKCGWYDIDEAIGKMGFPQEAKFLKKIKSNL